MQEFESISASSYDPSALATKLTAKAAEGWSVVAIVPTGGDVTAFVSREKSGADESPKSTETSEPVEAEAEDDDSSLVLPANSESASEPDPEPNPDAMPEAASEPAGWAIAPESSTPSMPSSETESQPAIAIQPSSPYLPSANPSHEPAAAAMPVAATPATPDPAPAPAVPAGWYADPAGRFELRYWDGSTWTEHVSRSGQQFTDPPVA